MSSKNSWIIIFLVILLGTTFIIFKNMAKPAIAPEPSAESIITASPSPQAIIKELLVNLSEQNSSSESGTAKLTQEDSKVIVTLNLTGAPKDTPQPAHIHIGNCPTVSDVKYPLTNVVNGKSETTLDVTLETLLSQLPLGINVHKSVPQIKTYAACGDINAP